MCPLAGDIAELELFPDRSVRRLTTAVAALVSASLKDSPLVLLGL